MELLQATSRSVLRRWGTGGGAFNLPARQVGYLMQGQLTQPEQVFGPEEVLQRRGHLLHAVYFTLLQPAAQLAHGQIHVHHLVGQLEQLVGHALRHVGAADAPYLVVQAFQVLHVHGRNDGDARFHELLHILPALLVQRAGHVGVGQLIHDNHRRLALQSGRHVHFLQHPALVEGLPAGPHRQPHQLGFGTGAGFRVAQHHVCPVLVLEQVVGFLEYAVGFAHPGCQAGVDLEPAAAAVLCQAQKPLGRLVAPLVVSREWYGGKQKRTAATG
ncbi:hypothetical protein GCM10022406_20530 [Hymenobacter algoricola]|uniref:Uncharacterized protein n=1 Tax=Hymenobacter algoricola TaxID=486267 RepID=A0ABP7N584_9BACT